MGARREHRVVDIAAQAGLSRATVDRVLHGREGVRPETVAQVNQAIDELERQREQVHLSGRTLIVDLVMQTPERFAIASRDALEAALRSLRPATLRARSHLSEHSDAASAAALLDAVGHRGSHGVILKAPDHPLVVDAVRRLADRGIPTVTFVTDVPDSRRTAYVGMDNVAAGATAAYLITQWAGPCGAVLVTVSHSSFRGEEERDAGFRRTLAELAPGRAVHEVKDTDGLDRTILVAVRGALALHPSINAVYSAGGGNVAILKAFEEVAVTPKVFVAHDLDGDNQALLRTRKISAVLHHDMRADMRRACRLLLQARGVLPGKPVSIPSQVQVVTPYNEPASIYGGSEL
ncbi:LacI family DNA-binding transcriptional regulator [Nonomuraea sp. NEAU-A123]|uniref:LacI family DNA-binding transcriptional regulator n=1 Tax=Nonomuraea sp. NEAU-A123 TaxID=2839649 RepID=UPI001BE3D06D|nr:LacI family DNA-binding transcriptional regulator [Nonomuraea sp. NEAU-A123]MBT2225290.1 LacI family DNA-binding transcriptional regulator [Nonomuraea sp. NEAU-A123]